jgi:hypothetical protein
MSSSRGGAADGHTRRRGCGAGADGVAETVAWGGDRGGWCGDGGQGWGRRRGSGARRQQRARGHADPRADCTAETTARAGAAAGAETVVGVVATGADPGNDREGRGVDGARAGDDGRGGARIRERTTRRKRQRSGRTTTETVVGAGAVGARRNDWVGAGPNGVRGGAGAGADSGARILGQPATAGRVGDLGGGGDDGTGGAGATYVGREEGVECGKGKKDKGHI